LTRLAVALVAVVTVLVVTGVIALPSVGDLLADLSDTLGAWTYLVVPALAFLETAAFLGLLVPGETAVLVGGAVAERGEVSVVALMLLVWAAAVAGDLIAFGLGRRLGGPFLRRHADRLHLKVEHLDRVEELFARRGGRAIVVGRFVGVLRAFTPFVAGTSGMSVRRFLPYSVGAALVWSVLLTLLGYVFASSFAAAGDVITRGTLAVAALVGIALLVRRAYRRRAGRGPAEHAPGAAPRSMPAA
jgi:membrane protein DedA with SNARE-associated domain